jgi:HSP20 family protein
MWRAKISNRAFDRMGERYAHLIDPYHFLGRSAFDIPWNKDRLVPPVNIKVEGELFTLELAVPGFTKEEITVTLEDDVLTIKGEKSTKAEEKEEGFILEEFDFNSFERKFRIADTIAHEKITAKLENGVLRLTFVDVPEEEEAAYQTVEVV